MGRKKKQQEPNLTFDLPVEEFKEPYKPEEWGMVVKRTTHPPQIVRVLTHQSAQTYFKDPTQTEHNPLTCEELDVEFGGQDFTGYQDSASRLLREAGTPNGLILGIRSKTLKTLSRINEGLKAFHCIITEDPNLGTVLTFTFTIAAKDGTYENTTSLVKGKQ